MRESPLASSSGADIAKPLHSRTTPGRWLPSHTHPAAARYGLLAHRWSPEAVCYWCCPCRVRRRHGLSSLLLSKTRRPPKARGADKHAGIAVDLPSTERMRDSQHLSGRDLNTLVSTDQHRIARQHEHDGESRANPVSGTWHGGDMMQREERIRVDRQNALGLGMANRQVVADHQAVKPREWQGHGGDGLHGSIEANAQMRLFARRGRDRPLENNRKVRRLLYFHDKDPRINGVHRAGRHKDSHSRHHLDPVHVTKHPVTVLAVASAGEFFCVHVRLPPQVHSRTWFAAQHQPRLCLSVGAVQMATRERAVRVSMYG